MLGRSILLAIGMTTCIGLANLLSNPGFENWLTDSLPADWRVEARNQCSAVREDETLHAGDAALRLTRLVSGTGNNRGVSQHTFVNPGEEYCYSVWCFDNTPGVALGMFLTWRDADSGFIRSEPVRSSRDSSGWQLLQDTVISPDNAARCEFVIRTYGESGAPAGLRVFADDARIEPPAPTFETTRVWFTEDSLAARLCDFVAGATSSIDYCCYNSSRPDVTLALIARRQAGVTVRVITDNARRGDQWVAYLRGSGITVWTDSIGPNSSAYMHNKFLVRDIADADTTNDRLWVASYNPNLNEVFADHALEIASTALCRAYQTEFNQMWGSSGAVPVPESARFHSGKTDRLATHDFWVDGYPARLYFSPQNRVVDTLTSFASRVQRELVFAVYSFTWSAMAQAVVAARNRGATVGGLMDRSSALDPSSSYRYLRENHIPVTYDSNLTVHEKIAVFDSTWAVTGSANWSSNANNANDENTLILSAPGIVRRMHAEIVRRYLAAGGTWPPGVAEESPSTIGHLPRPRFLRSRSVTAGMALRDVTGRVVTEPTPGLYFATTPLTGWQRVIVVR